MHIYVTKVEIESRAFSLGIEVIDVVNTSGSVNLGSEKKSSRITEVNKCVKKLDTERTRKKRARATQSV